MANHALFIGWGQPTLGRESKAIELYGTLTAYFTGLADQDLIESWEPVFLAAHGGDLGGYFLLRGDEEQLDTIRRSDEFIAHVVRSNIALDGFGVVKAYLGEGIQQIMGLYANSI